MTATSTSFHHAAMEAADEADAARRRGDAEAALKATRLALELEREAAFLAKNEPSRSVLLRSAATLALECGDLREAERLIATALASLDTPDEIADELRDLIEQVYFGRHLEVRGVALESHEFQMSITGDDVGYGLARTERFVRRVDDTQRLLQRTAARETKQAFRDAPGRPKRSDFETYVSIPRAASFAVSFRLARPHGQERLFDVRPESVVSEMLDCLGMLERGEEDKLRAHIPEEAYYRNFVALAKQIAPDGKAVKMVGFTFAKGSVVQRVAFTRQAKTITAGPPPGPAILQVVGRLLFADATRTSSSTIEVVTPARRKPTRVVVPPGMMADIVKPLWGEQVAVTCMKQGGDYVLTDIARAPPADPDDSPSDD